jgi:hypothetical protein
MKLYLKVDRKCLGELKPDSLDFLLRHLEEEYQSMAEPRRSGALKNTWCGRLPAGHARGGSWRE